MTDANPQVTPENVPEKDEEDEEFYNVEEIRARRINSSTGALEYLIKWEGYEEDANSWEPSDNLNCPDALSRFEEREREKEKEKQKKRRNSSQKATQIRANATDILHTPKKVRKDPLIIEEDSDSATEPGGSVASGKDTTQPTEPTPPPQPRGFERGLQIERIVGSCTDDNERLWFFIKWRGLNELELVEAKDIEDKAPRDMCAWYRERLYHTIKLPIDSN